MHHVDNFDGIGSDTIEDEIVPVNDPPDAAVPVTGHQWKGMGHPRQLGTTGRKLVNKLAARTGLNRAIHLPI